MNRIRPSQRLNPVRDCKNISVSLPQKMIDEIAICLRGRHQKRSHWVKNAIQNQLSNIEVDNFDDMSLQRVILRLLHRFEELNDGERVRLEAFYQNSFGDLPIILSREQWKQHRIDSESKNEPLESHEPS